MFKKFLMTGAISLISLAFFNCVFPTVFILMTYICRRSRGCISHRKPQKHRECGLCHSPGTPATRGALQRAARMSGRGTQAGVVRARPCDMDTSAALQVGAEGPLLPSRGRPGNPDAGRGLLGRMSSVTCTHHRPWATSLTGSARAALHPHLRPRAPPSAVRKTTKA